MVSSHALPTLNRRYQLESSLGSGAMGVVYKTLDRLTQDYVALKVVNASQDDLTFGSIGSTASFEIALAREFRLLASLRHPNVIRVMDYGFSNTQVPFFTMELLENAKTLLEDAHQLSQATALDILTSILQGLAYLHRRKILHRDLKPSNILLQNNQVKILDFGLSVSLKENISDELAGTLAYMAPELIQNQPATPASDLYSLGVLGYELLSGYYPFDRRHISKLVNDILVTQPDFSILNISAPLQTFFARLLAKSPEERYPNADAALQVLYDIMGHSSGKIAADIRDSYIQAASFVNRNYEWETLTQAMKATQFGEGSAWLLGGESGVGKSRLINELRTWGLVEGIHVIKGQEVPTGGQPFQIWLNIIRHMILMNEPSEQDAQVLKLVIPDIGDLLGYSVESIPELDAIAMQERLIRTVEHIIRANQTPLVIILEDIQWISSESERLLQRLQDAITDGTIALIASYRSDESENLAERFSWMRPVNLERLAIQYIAELTQEMLGQTTTTENAPIVDFLHQETGGNAYFLVETVRALAEHSGTLENIASTTLPANLVTGGIEQIILQRLDRIPLENLRGLQLAALYGRGQDERLLRTLIDDFDYWLVTCTNVAILEVLDNTIQFTHDKIRSLIQNRIDPAQIGNLHRQLALALEATATNRDTQTAKLAYHWVEAGDAEKALPYIESAARQALYSGNYEGAIGFVEQAKKLVAHPTKTQQASWTGLIGEAQASLGQVAVAKETLQETLALLGWKMPSSGLRAGIPILGQMLRQVGHRVMPKVLMDKRADTDTILKATRTLHSLSSLYFIEGNVIGLIYATFLGINLSEAAQRSPEILNQRAEFNGIMSVALATIPMHRRAQNYRQRGIEIAKQAEDFPNWTWARVLQVSSLQQLAVGEWNAMEESLLVALTIFQKLGDQRRIEEASGILGWLYNYNGQLHKAEDYWRMGLESVQERGDPHSECFSLVGLAGVIFKQKRQTYLEETRHLLDTAAQLVVEITDPNVQAMYYSLLAALNLAENRTSEAHQAAETALNIIRKARIRVSYARDLYAFTVETLLQLWQKQKLSQPEAQKALKVLQGYAKIIPIAEPAAHYYAGLYASLANNGDALQHYQTSLQIAESLQMPYEQALALIKLGRIDEANRIFASLDLMDLILQES